MSDPLSRHFEKRHRIELVIVTALLVASIATFGLRWLVSGRAWGIRYDLLFWHVSGGGYVGFETAGLCYLVAGSAVLACLCAMARKLAGRRVAWLLLAGVGILPAWGISASPNKGDAHIVADRGRPLITAIERFKAQTGGYPDRLQRLVPHYISAVPGSGLVKARRFYYRSKSSDFVDHGPWFNNPRALLGSSRYVLSVPLVPRGTLVYRPTGDYRDIKGLKVAGRWAITSID